MIPVLEVPSGELIPESGIQMEYAMQVGRNQGIDLIPADPVEAAKMRVKMAEFDKKLGMIFGVYLSRCADEKIDEFVRDYVPYAEALCPEVGSEKWLMGTEELTLLDIHCGAMWENVYTLMQAPANSQSSARANLQVNAPKWWAYIERLRAHPKLAKHAMNQEVTNAHWERTKGWQEGVKCQLSLDVVMGVYSDLP